MGQRIEGFDEVEFRGFYGVTKIEEKKSKKENRKLRRRPTHKFVDPDHDPPRICLTLKPN